MIDTTAGTSTIKDISRERFKGIFKFLRDRQKTIFTIVLYPESTPIEESYRAMLDLKEAGIGTQLVVANMILPERVCVNDFCGHAESSCPVTPPKIKRIHWPIDDPISAVGSKEEIMNAFRKARDEIKGKIEEFIEEIKNKGEKS